MADFKTPIPLFKPAVARVLAGVELPADAEDFRRRYQAAERSGDPVRPVRDVGDFLAEHHWAWPALMAHASRFQELGVWPLAWRQERLVPGFTWCEVPHAVRVRLMLASLATALHSERTLAEARGTPLVMLDVEVPAKCEAEAAAGAEPQARIAGGDMTSLPPFFPGSMSHLRLRVPKRQGR